MRVRKPEYRAQQAPEPELRADCNVRRMASMEIRNAMNAAEAMREKNEWTGAKPEHLVALYAQLHDHVYGVDSEEISDKRRWGTACVDAACMLEREFHGNVEAAVKFVAWVWGREKKARARANGREMRRLGCRLQFSAGLVNDYRVAIQAAR